MIINDKNTIFVHITKTGGQSVTAYLLKNLGVINFNALKQPKFALIHNKKLKKAGPSHFHHMFLPEYIQYGFISEDDLNKYFKFTIVRNPYSRFKSAFYFKGLHKETSYKKWCAEVEKLKYNPNSNLYRMFTTQTQYIKYKDIIQIDKLFYTENLEEFFTFFHKYYGFSADKIKKNKTTSNKKPLDKYTIDFINDFYHEDFKNFNYEKL
jgi:hypothetical protein